MSGENTETRRYLLEISFDGTVYAGWQIQPNGVTIQQTLETTLTRLYGGNPIRVQGSSRTDAGVHALGFTACYTKPADIYIPEAKVKKALNQMLPDTILIRNVTQVEDDFHPRYAARAKAYTYVINRGEITPFNSRWNWQVYNCNKLPELRKALDHLVGTHDFSAFTVNRKDIDDPVRTIHRIDIDEFGDLLCISVIGNGFLYKMVRGIIGAAATVGYGKNPPEKMQAILDSQNRCEGEETAPPHGLFLIKVFFEENEWQNFKLVQPPFYF